MGADVVQEHCHMDDLMPSTPTVDEEKETKKQPTELGDLVGFHIRKCQQPRPWVSCGLPETTDFPLDTRYS